MKIAIVTFQDAQNYGAVLQAFALKSIISTYAKCDVINYYNEYFHATEENRNFIRSIISGLYKKKRKIRANGFNKFLNEYIINFGEEIHDDGLERLNYEYDLFITGSDQVWNLQCSGHNTVYFLDFVKDHRKKSSYAASFGGDDIGHKKEYERLLGDFANISVREESGQKLIKDILGKSVPVVLDPTFLPEKEFWINSFQLRFSKSYILIYEVLNGIEIENYARELARKTGLRIVCITSSNKPKVGMNVIREAGPVEWLNLFSNSAYILTNSFHGVAFSLIFEKQFYVELLSLSTKTNTRITELLHLLNLDDRVLSKKGFNLQEINYNVINSNLKKYKDASLDYLMKIIQEGQV